MPYLLNTVYLLLLLAFSPWLIYSAIRKGKYRQGLKARCLGHVPFRDSPAPCIWLHGVSVGEVNLLEPLLERIRQDRPGWECVISTTTRTGYEVACRKYPGHLVFYCPLDFSWAVEQAMRRIRPDLLVLAELELWPNLIRAAQRHGASVALVNGRLSQSSARGYRWIRPLIARVLRQLDLIAAQNETYAERFRRLGARPATVQVTGSMKFDGAQCDRLNPETTHLAQLAGISQDDIVFLAGSTQAPEEALAVQVFQRLSAEYPQLRLIVTPRHPERFDEVARMLDDARLSWQRRSALSPQNPPGASRVLLVDAVGELRAWWGTAHIAFVGGSMGRRGGQNMIEPAAYGAAVCFGPNTRNFRDIVCLMLEQHAAAVVDDGQQLAAFVRRCLAQPQFAQQLGDAAQRLVQSQQGATQRTAQLLTEILAVDQGHRPRQHRPHNAGSTPGRKAG